jgi:hypothetical protein
LFHVFCDMKDISEAQRAPACAVLLSAFVSALAGTYAPRTIVNYLAGVRAWHIIHGLPWQPNAMETDALIKAAEGLRPASSRRKLRRPFTVEYILALRSQLDPMLPLDAAVFACLTTTFYAAARLGEFTVTSLKPGSFHSSTHVTPSHVTLVHDRNGLSMLAFRIPRTKSAPSGEEVSWAKQHGLSDPEAALARHLQVNAPPADGPLFAYRSGKGHRALTKSKMLAVLSRAALACGLDPLQGHGIRIGSTLEYLLRGVPFEVVKVKGRWASDSFRLYLRKHAQILAPYMQVDPVLHEAFTRLTMPPVR